MNSDHTMTSDDTNDTTIHATPDSIEGVDRSDENKTSVPRPSRPPRSKVQFLCPSTKFKDIRLAEKEGRKLENRRVRTLIIDKSKDSVFFNGTSTRPPESSQGTLNQTPYKDLITPASCLSANRWLFLPDSPVPLEDDYLCPESVKLRLEEEVTHMKKEKVEFLTDVELFEAREFIIKWVVQESGSDDLVEFIMEKKMIDFTELYNYVGEG